MTTSIHTTPFPTVSLLPPLDRIGFDLGRDYALHDVTPPTPYAAQASPLRDGLRAGRAAFGARTLAPTRPVCQWLRLRLDAWLRGLGVEPFQITPHYLRQLDASHCPITRVALPTESAGLGDAAFDRVRNDAGYAAGNLAVMSRKAHHAKAAHGFGSALALARQVEAEQAGGSGGLSADQWARVAVLCSFVEPMPHAEACALPLLLLPPNRLRLFNPAQALQAMLSRQFLEPGWSQRLSRFEDLLPGAPLKRDFKGFVMALLPRVLEAGKLGDSPRTRWAIEDAWRSALVLQRWTHFACQLSAAQCEALLVRAAAKKLATVRLETLSDAQATEGWHLASRGYVPHVTLPGSALRTRGGAPQQLAL